MWFQLLLIVALAGIAVYLLRSTPSPRHLAIRRLVVLVVILAGVVVVLAPGVLSEIARFVGVGRGSDLLFYTAIMAGLLYIVSEYKRSARSAKTMTSLARELTLTEARLADRIALLEDERADVPSKENRQRDLE